MTPHPTPSPRITAARDLDRCRMTDQPNYGPAARAWAASRFDRGSILGRDGAIDRGRKCRVYRLHSGGGGLRDAHGGPAARPRAEPGDAARRRAQLRAPRRDALREPAPADLRRRERRGLLVVGGRPADLAGAAARSVL